MTTFLFKSERLGFREWQDSDLAFLNKLNSNLDTMRFFPEIPNKKQNQDFLNRMKLEFKENAFCYFLVEELHTGIPIGLMGILNQNFKSNFTPAVDIGWRLLPSFWGKGYATEGAKKCLEFGFNVLKLNKIISIAPEVNQESISVMRKIGMEFIGEFEHPKLVEYPNLQKCLVYEIVNR